MAGHLTAAERDRIAQLFHQGATRIEIARAVERSPATIGRELARNGRGDEYFAAHAQERARQRRRDRPLERMMDREAIKQVVHAGLTGYWSPDQIACRLRREHPDDPERHVSAQTIYNWIGQLPDEQRTHYQQFLRRRGMRPRRHRENTGKNQAAGIADRPEVIEQRGRIGDFEGDTLLGPPGSGGLVTLVDRRSRYCILGKVASKHADRVYHKIRDRLQPLDEHQRRSLTFDNGSEFARCHRLDRHLKTPLYFADPGCPYQRGTNENTNGLIRQFFPKGTDFRNITHHEVRRVENLLNNRPRACLDYQTPNEVFSGQSASAICD